MTKDKSMNNNCAIPKLLDNLIQSHHFVRKEKHEIYIAVYFQTIQIFFKDNKPWGNFN